MTRNTSFRAWVIPIKGGRARGLEDVAGNVCTCRSCDVMVMRHQFQQYRAIKEKDTCTMIVDFSENFTCGHNRAIQSSHFGASNKQVTLHTGVAYTHSKTLSFCRVSESTRHDAAAIAHMSRPNILAWTSSISGVMVQSRSIETSSTSSR